MNNNSSTQAEGKKHKEQLELLVQYHTRESIYRIGWYIISIVITGIVAWKYGDVLGVIYLNIQTENKLEFQYLGVYESISTYFKWVISWAILITLPYGLYSIKEFIKPGFTKNEMKKLWYQGLIGSILIFIFGIFFGYTTVWPRIIKIVQVFNQNELEITMMLQVSNYISGIFQFIFSIGLAAIVPYIIAWLILHEYIKYDIGLKFRRWFWVGIFIFAAIISPPDVFSQLIIALPFIFGLELAWFYLALKLAYKNIKTNSININH